MVKENSRHTLKIHEKVSIFEVSSIINLKMFLPLGGLLPKLTKFEINRRAQNLCRLYIKHKGNKSRIAKELGISQPAMGDRFNNEVGKAAKERLKHDLEKAAEKLGINIYWYLEELKKGATQPIKIIDFIYDSKEKGQKKSQKKLIAKSSIDWSVRHKYFATLGETMKYVRNQPGDAGQKVQVFIGSEISQFVKTVVDNRVRSDAGLD